MVICPQCLTSTAGELGEEVTCSHCATRFHAGEPVAAPPSRGPPPKKPPPTVPLWLKLFALLPYVAPVVAVWIFVYRYQELGSNLASRSLAVAIYALGLIAAIVVISRAGKVTSRWISVGGWGLAFAIFGMPIVCLVLVFLVFAGSRIPGG